MKIVKYKTLLIAAILIFGCREIEVDSGNPYQSEIADLTEGPGSPGSDAWGVIPEFDGLGHEINCFAPDRDEYIKSKGGDPETKEGDIESLEHTILFIFDKSGSMDSWWDNQSKWDAASAAMKFSVDLYSEYVAAGTIFFPTDDNCKVDPITDESQINFSYGDSFLEKWEKRMSSTYPDGSTPMEQAFEQADKAIAMACYTGIMKRPMKVVVIADGEPNCNCDDDILTEYPKKWLAHGVKTFVIGVPGHSSASNLLEDIAKAGGGAQEVIARRVTRVVTTYDIDTDVDTDTVTAPVYVPKVDTSGIIDPGDESEIAESIAICIE